MSTKEQRNEPVEILEGDKGYVDLAYPIMVTEEQRKNFIKLLKKIYDPRIVIEKKVKEFKRDWRIGERVLYPRLWTEEEYLVLFESDSIEKIAKLLGRSPYASGLKDADWRYKLLSFCDKYEYDLTKENKLEIIKKFMKTQEEFNKFRKELRKERNKLKKELESLESPERKKTLEFLKTMKKISDEDLKKEENKKNKIRLRLKQIEEGLNKDIEQFDS